MCTPHGFFCEGCFWNGVFLGRVWCVLYIYLSLKGVCHSWAKKRGRGRDSGQKESQSGQKKTSSGQKAWKWAKVRVWGKFNHYIGKQQQLRLGFWILGVWIFRPTVSVIVSLTNSDLLPVPIAGTDRTRSMAKPSWSWGTCSQWVCWCSSSLLSRLPVAHSLSRLTVALFPVLSPGRSCPCHVSRSLMSLSRLPVPLFPVLMLLLVCFPKSCCDPATGEPGALVQKVQSPDDYLTIKRTSIETSSMQTDCT